MDSIVLTKSIAMTHASFDTVFLRLFKTDFNCFYDI